MRSIVTKAGRAWRELLSHRGGNVASPSPSPPSRSLGFRRRDRLQQGQSGEGGAAPMSTYIDFYGLLDNTPSMGVGATPPT
jgi:hypothetical protein